MKRGHIPGVDCDTYVYTAVSFTLTLLVYDQNEAFIDINLHFILSTTTTLFLIVENY